MPSDYDETGGVAKVDVSNIYEYSSLSFFFAYPIVPTSLPHIYSIILIRSNVYLCLCLYIGCIQLNS